MSFVAALSLIVLVTSGCDGGGTADNKIIAPNGGSAKSTAVTASTSPEVAERSSTPVNSTTSRSSPQPEPSSTIGGITEPRKVKFADAERAFKERRFDDGVRLFAAYTEQHDTNPWGFYMLGLSAMKSGDSELAESSFNRALELDSTHVKSWLNLGRTLLDLYRSEEALLAVEHAFEIDPEVADAYRIKGRSLHAMGRYEDAADAYRDALRMNDKDVWAMNNLALILIEQERYELALPSLARATQLRTDIAFIYNNLGMALERTYRFRAAEEAYATAISIDASHIRAAANLERIKAVEQESEIEPIDFDELAQNFVDEIDSWSDEDITREAPLIWPRTDPSVAFPDHALPDNTLSGDALPRDTAPAKDLDDDDANS